MLKAMKVIGAALAASVLLAACSKNDTPSPAQSPQAQHASAQLPADEQITSPAAAVQTLPELPAPPPPPPRHIYGYEESGRYGYEPAISDDEQKAGVATKALVMFRYLGMLGNRYIIESASGNTASRIECEAPCEYVKSITVTTYGAQKTEVLHLAPNALLSGVFFDAMNGLLRPTSSRIDHLFPTEWSIAQAPVPVPEPVQPAVAQLPPPVVSEPTTTTSIQPSSTQPDTQLLPPDEAPATKPATYTTSFDCTKARSDAEHLICDDPTLAAADVSLAATFARAKAAARDPAVFKERTRQQWNYREQNCHDRTCLVRWYADQQTNLEAIASTGNL